MAHQPQFKKTVFENGLTVLSEQLDQFRSLSLGVWVKVGTRHETPSVAGVSHFLEHMLFKGTKTRSALQIALEVDEVGGEFNAFTAREHTCFHLFLLDRDYDLGLEILSDVLLNSHFKQSEIDRERRVILQEIAMVEESPEELAHDLFFEHVYGNQGLGQSILGTEKSVCAMKRSDITGFFNRHYRPNQLILSVAGNVSHQQVLRKIKPLTQKSWPGRNRGVSSRAPHALVGKSSPQFYRGSWWVERPTEQVHLIWGVPGPCYSSSDRFAAFLLNIYLGGGMSSSLFQEIREKHGLAYTVYSSLSPFMDSGVFSIYAATGISQVALCLRLIEQSVEKIKKIPLTKEELRVMSDNLKSSILLSSDCVESRMSSIARNDLFLGRYYSLDEICQLIDQVTPADLQRVANQLFQDSKRSILALGPKPNQALRKLFLGM